MLLPSTFAGTSATPGPAGYSEYMLTAAHAHALPPHLIPNGVLGITDEELARMRRSPRCHPLWACGCQHGSWCVAIGQLCWVHLQCGASCCNHPINQPPQHNAPGAAASKRRQRAGARALECPRLRSSLPHASRRERWKWLAGCVVSTRATPASKCDSGHHGSGALCWHSRRPVPCSPTVGCGPPRVCSVHAGRCGGCV